MFLRVAKSQGFLLLLPLGYALTLLPLLQEINSPVFNTILEKGWNVRFDL